VARSLGFAVVTTSVPDQAMDLGSGGGLPGLVLALAWTTSHWLFIDSNQRRTKWLTSAVRHLGLADRCQVVCERAEIVGHSSYRHTADLVTARSFGPPGPTAECGAPLLRVGGHLLVADPPDARGERWPVHGLDLLGLALEKTEAVRTAAGTATISCLVLTSECPALYARRVGVPFKRRLF
jgi:16S rRNA (guanine527-N7)-methyltransferase